MLGEILQTHGIQKQQLAAAVLQSNGEPCSPALISRLINHGEFPKTTSQTDVWWQIADFLRGHGVPAQEIKEAWRALNPQPTATNETTETTETTNEVNDMSKPVLTQAARRMLGILEHVEPFENDIRGPDDLYLSSEARYIRAHLRNAGLNGGFIAIVSEPGGGKTTLANDLEQYAHENRLNVKFIRPDHINVEKLTAASIYDAIIDDVSEGAVTPKRTLEYRARQAKRLLVEAHRNGTRHILVIEEAQGLHHATLKNLKRFWELKTGHETLLGIVLIGQTELKRHLQDDAWQVREVALRCQVLELRAMGANEVAEYLTLKLGRVGINYNGVFEPDAAAAIHARLQDGQVSFAYPQRINNLAIRVFNKWAEIGGLPKIPGELVLGDLKLRGE